MDLLADRYYRASGAVPPMGAFLMLATGAGTAAVVSFVYSLLDYYNPFIYVTFLATIFFGFCIGYAVNQAAKAGAVRSGWVKGLIGFLCGVVALYFAWVWFIWMLAEWNTEILIWNPLYLLLVILEVGQQGVWEIKGGKPTGWGLYSFWLIEAGIVTIVSALTAMGDTIPYCEACGRWTDKQKELLRLGYGDFNAFKADLEGERYEILDQFAALPVRDDDYLAASIHRCAGCDESNYLSITQTQIVIKDNKPETKTHTLISHLSVPVSVVEQIERLIIAQNLDPSEVESASTDEEPPAEPSATDSPPA